MEPELSVQVDKASLSRNYDHFVGKYDKRRDIFYMRLEKAPPAVSVDCDGLFWLRVNPENGEIVGIEVEGFSRLRNRWRNLKMSKRDNNEKPNIEPFKQELAQCQV